MHIYIYDRMQIYAWMHLIMHRCHAAHAGYDRIYFQTSGNIGTLFFVHSIPAGIVIFKAMQTMVLSTCTKGHRHLQISCYIARARYSLYFLSLFSSAGAETSLKKVYMSIKDFGFDAEQSKPSTSVTAINL